MFTPSKAALLSVFIVLLLPACSTHNEATEALQDTADIVLRNAYVYTVDPANSVHQAVAIKANRIIYVGDNEGVQDYVGKDTDIRDLDVRMLLPGEFRQPVFTFEPQTNKRDNSFHPAQCQRGSGILEQDGSCTRKFIHQAVIEL